MSAFGFSFLQSIENLWRQVLTDWKLKNKGTVRKDQFPGLLKKTLNELGKEKIRDNLKAGFKKSGIHPLSKNKVLKELPQEETTESLPWAESFEEFLQSTREKETVTQPRKKNISVTPGRSLSQDDFMDTLRDLGKATATTAKVQKNTAKKLKLAEENNKLKNMEKPVVEVSDESDFSDHPVGAVAKRKNQKQNIRNKKTTKENDKKQSKTTKRYDEESDNDSDLIDDDLFYLHDSDTSVGPEDFSDLNKNKPEDWDDIDERKKWVQ